MTDLKISDDSRGLEEFKDLDVSDIFVDASDERRMIYLKISDDFNNDCDNAFSLIAKQTVRFEPSELVSVFKDAELILK